jgi:hypothetical protein
MQVGNEAGVENQFMQGMGLMGQSMYNQMLAGRQAVANLFSVDPQKLKQVQQQRMGYQPPGAGGAMNPMTADPFMGSGVPGQAPSIQTPPPAQPGGPGDPAARATGPSPIDVPPEVSGGGSGGGNKGGGNKGGGGGPKGPGGPGGRTPVGGMDFSRGSMLGGATNVLGMAAPVMMGVGNITEGKTVEGAGNIAGGAAALAATRGMNPLLRLGAAGLGAMGVGGLGQIADRKIAETTGQGSEEYNQEKQRYQQGQNLSTWLQGMNAVQKTALENDLLRMKAQEPVINRMLDAQLVRQQAMNASLTNSYAMLGTLATASKMAQQGQREAGANFRTAIQSNPFGNSVVAQPSISF